MNKTHPFPTLILGAVATLGVAAMVNSGAAHSQGATPPAVPPPPAAARADDDLDAQLDAARKRLEEAAHQVAELSTQMSRPLIEKFAAMAGEPGRAILGQRGASGDCRRNAAFRRQQPVSSRVNAAFRFSRL